MEPRTQISLGIESFLDYLRETERELHIAEQTEQAANDATQDILHRLELCELEDVDAERLAISCRRCGGSAGRQRTGSTRLPRWRRGWRNGA